MADTLPTIPTVKIDLDAHHDFEKKTGRPVSLKRGLNLYYLFLDTFHSQHNDIVIQDGSVKSYSLNYTTDAPLDDELAEQIIDLATLVPEAKISVRIKGGRGTKSMSFRRSQLKDILPAMLALMKADPEAEISIEAEDFAEPNTHVGVTINGKPATPEDIKILEQPVDELFDKFYKEVVNGLLGTHIVTIGQLIAHTPEHLMQLSWTNYDVNGRYRRGEFRGRDLDYIRLTLRKNNLPPLGTRIDGWRPEKKAFEDDSTHNNFMSVNNRSSTNLQVSGVISDFEFEKTKNFGSELVEIKENQVKPEKYAWLKASLLRYRLLPGDKIAGAPLHYRRSRY